MSKSSFPMTQEGLSKLKEELSYLQSIKREENKRRVKQARSFCDFREDPVYADALNERINI